MRPATCCILLALAASCAEPNDGPTIIIDNPSTIPFQPPQVTEIDPPAGTAIAFTQGTIRGVSLNLQADASDTPAIALTLTRDLAGVPVHGGAVPATVHSLGVQINTGVGVVAFAFRPPSVGLYTMSITNAAGTTTLRDAVAVLPDFTFTPPSTQVYCGDGAVDFTVPGSSSVIEGGVRAAASASVEYQGPLAHGFSGWPVSLEGCVPVPLTAVPSISVCSALVVHYPGRETSRFDHQLLQQAAVSLQDTFSPMAPPFPLFFEFSHAVAQGPTVFAPAQVTLAFDGSFVVDQGQIPAVTLDGTTPVAATAKDCVDTGVPGKQFCAHLQATVPEGTAPGTHLLAAQAVSGCTSTMQVTVSAPPSITSVTPDLICLGQTGLVQVDGAHFFSATPLVDGVPTFTAGCTSTSCTFPPTGLAPGPHQVSVRSSLNVPLDAAPVAVTFNGHAFLDSVTPSTLLAGSSRSLFATIFGKTGAIRSASLKLNVVGGGVFAAQVEDVAGGAIVTPPPDAPAGRYVLTVLDDSPCPGTSFAFVDLAAAPEVYSQDFEGGPQSTALASFDASGRLQSTFAALWSSTGGAPGGAVSVNVGLAAPPGSLAFDVRLANVLGDDLGNLSFDLQACPFATAPNPSPVPLEPAQVKLLGSQLLGNRFSLTRTVAAPAGCNVYSHYDLAFDGSWTYTDAQGTRAAQAADFAANFDVLFVPAVFSSDEAMVSLDNVVFGLAH